MSFYTFEESIVFGACFLMWQSFNVFFPYVRVVFKRFFTIITVIFFAHFSLTQSIRREFILKLKNEKHTAKQSDWLTAPIVSVYTHTQARQHCVHGVVRSTTWFDVSNVICQCILSNNTHMPIQFGFSVNFKVNKRWTQNLWKSFLL